MEITVADENDRCVLPALDYDPLFETVPHVSHAGNTHPVDTQVIYSSVLTENILFVPAKLTTRTEMESAPKRWWPNLFLSCLPRTRPRAASDPSPLSASVHDNPIPSEVISTQAPPNTSLASATASVPHVAKVEVSPTIGTLKIALEALQTSLGGVPLRPAVDGLLECIVHLQVEEQNRKSFEALASQLADLVNLLQKHPLDSKPQNVPYSIEFVVRGISEQTKIIKSYQNRPRIRRLASAVDDQEALLESYRQIGALFQWLQADISLSTWDFLQRQQMETRIERLSPVHEARYQASVSTAVAKREICTKNTRVQLLEDARTWVADGNAPKINWLNGMAGTGKTTIANTICQMLHRDKQLAASFFCSRNSSSSQDVKRILPTIAYQLGRCSVPYRKALCNVLEDDPDVASKDIGTQFERLISKPLEELGDAMPNDVVVVIDALDECTDVAGTKDVLNVLIRHASTLPIKFFVASRPEPAISRILETRNEAARSIIRLHDIERSLVQEDIKLYLTEALESIEASPSEIDQLSARADNLFIFAATAVRYILPETETVNNRKRLREVLELQPNPGNLRHRDIDKLYTTILSNALKGAYNEAELATRRQVLWTVICAKEPLTLQALSEVLDIPDDDIQPTIPPLQSVLHVSKSTSVVSPLHASFPDFLLNKERAGQFHCDEVVQNSDLAACCFRLMARSLKFNICGLESSYTLDRDVPNLKSRVNKAISTGLFYSCRYWGNHLTRGPPMSTLHSLLDSFLQHRLLFWMEVLNLSGRIGHGDIVLGQILAWLPTDDEWAELRDLTYDARNFLTSFAGNPTLQSTPHIYVSTLPFTSKESRVRSAYWPRTRGLMDIKGVATEGGGNSALATWDVGSAVLSIARSSDGRRIVSGFYNGEVSVWDVSSGTRILGPLKAHETWINSVTFSPDSSRIVSGSEDKTVRVWDAHNGQLVIGPLCGHTDIVHSVAFSPDGTRLASGSDDCTIRMWDAHTGAEVSDAYEGHQGAVQSVAFSPDGVHLASGSADETIRVWNWRTGVAAMGPMEGHTKPVRSIAYSSDGSRLASGSGDCTVRVWDMSNGTLLAGPFEGHTFYVQSVSFSPNDTQVVSGSADKTIRVWEAESGSLLAGPFKGHGSLVNSVLFTTDGTRILSGSYDGMIRVWDVRHRTTGATESLGHSDVISSVAMSPDGTRVASGSDDETICVWDTHNGALVAGPLTGHTEGVTSIAFSPNGARIVSGSWDHTLRTWDASTGTLLAGPFEGHTESVSSVAFSPNGSRVASSADDHTIRLWDSHTGKPVADPFHCPSPFSMPIAFSPDGARLVSGSESTVRMCDASDGTALWSSGAHTDWVRCVAFSLDGTRVVSGSSDETILVLGAGDGAVLHGPFTGHTSHVFSVAFSPDGVRVVSGSWDQTVRVWDVESGEVVIGPLKGHTHRVFFVAFSPDGARIVSGSADGTIRFWDVAAATHPDVASFDGWTIDDDGWVVDSQSQRLIWVPPNLRDGFWFPTPSNPLVANVHSTTRVDHTTLLGDRWHRCYDASVGFVSS